MTMEENLIEEIHLKLGCTEQDTLKIIKVALDDIKTFDSKHRDYGRGNIASFGEFGILVRTSDKLERLKNLHKKQDNSPSNEAIEDSWKDISVYGMIARLVRKGLW